jgi:hypothetical protein
MTILIRAIYSTCLCSLLILSCSKPKDEETDETPPVDPCDQIVKVETYNYAGNPPTSTAIEYDEQGRVKHVTGEALDAATYTYYKDSLVLSATNEYGNDISVKYLLDAKGRITGTSIYENMYAYNADGYMVSFRMPYYYTNQMPVYVLYNLKYENRDLIEMTSTDNNVSRKKINFKYYDETNQDLLGYNQPLFIGVLPDRNSYYLTKAGFFGKQSAHLLKNVTTNDLSTTADVQYIKDAKGRITSIVHGFAFTYRCP